MFRLCRLFGLIAFSTLALSGLAAQQPAIAALALDDAILDQPIPVAALSIWLDPTAGASVEAVADHADFRPLTPDASALGYYAGDVWLRLRLNNPQAVPWIILSENYGLDRFSVYQQQASGFWRESSTGWAFAASTRYQPATMSNLRVDLNEEGETTLYLRLSSDTSVRVDLSLFRSEGFLRHSNQSLLISGLLMGMGLAMLVFNLVISRIMRHWHYLFFIFYIVLGTIMIAYNHGFGNMFLWPDWPWVGRMVETLGIALAAIASNLFIIRFLDLASHTPVLYRVTLVYSGIFGLAIIAYIVLPDRQAYFLSALMSIALPFAQFGMTITAVVRKVPRSRFFLAAWSLLLVMVILLYLRNFGLVPSSPLLDYGTDIGYLLQMATLSFALLDRVNQTHELENANVGLSRINGELQNTLVQLEHTQQMLRQTEKMALVGRMVGGMAHELSTPIGNGLMSTSFLVEHMRKLGKYLGLSPEIHPELSDELMTVNSTLDLINNNLQRSAKLIGSFKQLAVDQSPEQAQSLNLPEFLSLVARQLQPEVEKSGIRLSVDCPNLAITCQAQALMQVFRHLADNALNHAGMVAGTGEVQFRVWQENSSPAQICIEFRDNGRGVDPALLPQLFEPFFTTDRAHQHSGLGLNLVHNLVVWRLNGRISCRNHPEGGLEVLIELPAAAPSEASP